MKICKPLLSLPILLMLGHVNAFAQTQTALNQQACEKYQQVDTNLNKTYQNILTKYKKNKNFIAAFVNAQKQWIIFRDAHVRAVYPEQKENAYGSIYPTCKCELLEELSTYRLKQITVWLNGKVEGDPCIGSIRP